MTRATDLPAEARAFLDALAVGESGGADDDAAYSALYGGDYFVSLPSGAWGQEAGGLAGRATFIQKTWPVGFPQWSGVWLHGVPTHAAGRYQFEPATWRDVAGRHHLLDFSPVSQDHAAWTLACEVFAKDAPLLSYLQAADDQSITPSAGYNGHIGIVATTLHSTWTSLSAATFPTRYRAALAKLTA